MLYREPFHYLMPPTRFIKVWTDATKGWENNALQHTRFPFFKVLVALNDIIVLLSPLLHL